MRLGMLASTLVGATSSFESEIEGALPVGRARNRPTVMADVMAEGKPLLPHN